jgi:hypothetical protein
MTDRDTDAQRASTGQSAAEPSYDGYLQYRTADNTKQNLTGQTPFFLYWWHRLEPGWFYPVGVAEQKDMSPQKSAVARDLVPFRFSAPVGEPLTWESIQGRKLEYRVRGTTTWANPSQRKGVEYCFALSGGEWPFQSVARCFVYDDAIRFALRMDMDNKGDAWIADETITNSIRMQSPEDDRAALIAVSYGDGENPYQSPDQMIDRRTWDDLVS